MVCSFLRAQSLHTRGALSPAARNSQKSAQSSIHTVSLTESWLLRIFTRHEVLPTLGTIQRNLPISHGFDTAFNNVFFQISQPLFRSSIAQPLREIPKRQYTSIFPTYNHRRADFWSIYIHITYSYLRTHPAILTHDSIERAGHLLPNIHELQQQLPRLVRHIIIIHIDCHVWELAQSHDGCDICKIFSKVSGILSLL